MSVRGYNVLLIDVKDVFLKDIKNNEETCMAVPEWFQEFYPNENIRLHIMKPIEVLKQAGFTTTRKLRVQCKLMAS